MSVTSDYKFEEREQQETFRLCNNFAMVEKEKQYADISSEEDLNDDLAELHNFANSPMFSCSPRFVTMPDLDHREKLIGKKQEKYRRRILKKQNEERRKQREEDEKKMEEQRLAKRERTVSFGDVADYNEEVCNKSEELHNLADEEDQWKKRKKKVKSDQNMQKATSNTSLVQSIASSINLMEAHFHYSPNQVVRDLTEGKIFSNSQILLQQS